MSDQQRDIGDEIQAAGPADTRPSEPVGAAEEGSGTRPADPVEDPADALPAEAAALRDDSKEEPRTATAEELSVTGPRSGTTAGDEDATSGQPGVDPLLKAIVEALVFASPDPLSLKAMGKVLEGESPETVEAAVAALKHDYERAGGLQLVEVAGGFQIVTRPDLHEWVRRLFHERTTQKLSVAALETLAVIAYKQPITSAEITEVRGVNTSGVLGTLIDRKLIKIVGRKPVVGRPFMYATTREFLNRFGLRDLNDLPKVEDMADALGFEPPLLEDVASNAVLPFDAEPAEVPVGDSEATDAAEDVALAPADTTSEES